MPIPVTKWSGTTTGLSFPTGSTLAITTATGFTVGTIVINGTTAADVLMLGAKVGVCNDNSPSAVPTAAVVLYFDGTDVIVKRQSDSKTSKLSASWA